MLNSETGIPERQKSAEKRVARMVSFPIDPVQTYPWSMIGPTTVPEVRT